jgi:uncharacterized protein
MSPNTRRALRSIAVVLPMSLLSGFAEVSPQYDGVALDDPRWQPYFALAEELDVPVGVHLGEGPPGGPYWAARSYRARLTTPLQLEKLLIRHQKLRLCD